MKITHTIRKRVGVAVVAAALVAQCAVPAVTYAATTTQSVFVPGYSYPQRWAGGDNRYWQAIEDAGAQKVPFVVVNPNSGPGDSVSNDYTQQLAALDAKGIKYIGYVKHNRQQRDIKEVAAEIDAWYKFYPGIKGMFFDETHNESNPTQTCYIANLYNYMKVKHPGSIVVHNPGTRLRNESIVPYGDIFMVAETSANEYLNDPYLDMNHPDAQPFEKNPANAPKIWHAVHDVTSVAEQDRVLEVAKQRNAGWVYFTSDSLTAGDSNPYNNLSSYFTDHVNKASAMPPTTPQIGKPVALPAGCNDVFNLSAAIQNPPATPPASPAPSPAPAPAPNTPGVSPPAASGQSQAAGAATAVGTASVARHSGDPQAPNTGHQRQTLPYTIFFVVAGLVLAVIGWIAGRRMFMSRRR